MDEQSDENSCSENKQYTNLSTVNIEKHILNAGHIFEDVECADKYDFMKRDTTNQENIPPYYSESFLLDSSYIKKYYTKDSELEALKAKQVVEPIKDDSMGIEVDFDSGNDSRNSDYKDVSISQENSINTNSETGKRESSDIDHKSWISGLEMNLKTWENNENSLENDEEMEEDSSKAEEKMALPEGVGKDGDSPIKTETLDEDMITILVPQDMDVKNIKLEPEDSGYEQFSCLDDEDEVYEVDDNEDFYIIQVQDSDNANKMGKCKKREAANKAKSFGSPQLAKCDLCEYHTYDKSNLRKHKLIHTDLKPYSCDFCSFTCKLPKYLKQHMVTHMTVRLFPCTVCCHRCRNLTELNRHIKRHLRLNKRSTVEELTEEERSYCVCRDGCKTDTRFKRLRREKKP